MLQTQCLVFRLLKDNISTKGILTTAASKMLYNYEPVLMRLLSKIVCNDMIIVGKTNMDEFAMGGSTENSAFKPTKNAWDETKVPGGSSGGSATAVAANQVLLSLVLIRWLNPSTCIIQWCGWSQTNLWSYFALWFDCLWLIT